MKNWEKPHNITEVHLYLYKISTVFHIVLVEFKIVLNEQKIGVSLKIQIAPSWRYSNTWNSNKKIDTISYILPFGWIYFHCFNSPVEKRNWFFQHTHEFGAEEKNMYNMNILY